MLPFRGRSITLVYCTNGRRYRHDFFSMRQRSVSPYLHRSNSPLYSPYFAPKWPTPWWFERRRRRQIAVEWWDSAMVTMERNHHYNCNIADPTTATYSKMGVANAFSRATSRRVLPPGEYDRKAMSPFVKFLRPLFSYSWFFDLSVISMSKNWHSLLFLWFVNNERVLITSTQLQCKLCWCWNEISETSCRT